MNHLNSRSSSDDLEYEDEKRLAQLGYKQELSRSLTFLSTLGIAFTILSIPTSLLPLLYLGIGQGGPMAMFGCWLVVSFFSLFVGLSMSEISSAYPTSGGLYFWTFQLSPPRFAPMLSYFTGYLNFVGLWGVAAGTVFDIGEQFGSTLFTLKVLDRATLPEDDIRYRLLVYAVACVCLFLCGWVSLLSTRTLDRIGQVFLLLNVAGILVLAGTTAFSPRIEHIPLSELFGSFYNNSGFSDSYVWLIALLPATITYTGYDSAGHMAEETKGAATSSPVAIMSSIAMSIPIGFFTLWAFVGAISKELYPDIGNRPTEAVDIMMAANGETGGVLLTWLLMILSWSCTFGLVATHCRMVYAFARDGGLPGSKWLYSLTPKKIPFRALLVTLVLDAVILMPSIYSEQMNIPVNSIGTVGTYVAYLIPIFLRLIKGSKFESGPFKLPPMLGWFCALVSTLWLTFAPLCIMLPTVQLNPDDFTSSSEYWGAYISNFNFSSIMIALVLILSGLVWTLSARHWFIGPKHMFDEEEFTHDHPHDDEKTVIS